MKTEVPIEAEDIQLCADANAIVSIVRNVAEDQDLSFHYGTHAADYGTQTTFRLIGSDFELELFNSMSQSDYTLRVYQSGGGDKGAAKEAFRRFRDEIRTQLDSNCSSGDTIPGT